MDEGSKARKILIARHRKKKFMERFHCGYLQKAWILLYTAIVGGFLWGILAYEKSKFEFVINEWQLLHD